MESSVFGGKTLVFLVGVNKRQFVLHTQLLKKLAPALIALAHKPLIDLVDEDTFARFAQFLYTGNYDVDEPTKRAITFQQPRPDHDLEDSPTSDDGDTRSGDSDNDSVYVQERLGSQDLGANTSPFRQAFSVASFIKNFETYEYSVQQNKRRRLNGLDDNWPNREEDLNGAVEPVYPRYKRTNKYTAMKDFSTRICPNSQERMSYPFIGFKPRQNTEARECYTEMFLSNARLYAFAVEFDIFSLQSLIEFKIHKTLQEFTLFHQRIPDVIVLIEYVYDKFGIIGAFRDILILYVVSELGDPLTATSGLNREALTDSVAGCDA